MFDGEKSTKGVLLPHMIYQKTRTQNLADVKAINLWGYELEDISVIGELTNAETIALPINKITTLAPFATCYSLRNLLLRQNLISDFNELDYLQGLTRLTHLSLSDNPIARDPNYREIVIRKLPQLQKLDDVDVSVKAPRANENMDRDNVRFDAIPPVQPRRKGLLRKSESTGMKKQFNLAALAPQCDESPKSSRWEPSPVKAPPKVNARRGDDSNMLTAVLSLIPELSADSLQIVLQAIHQRCM